MRGGYLWTPVDEPRGWMPTTAGGHRRRGVGRRTSRDPRQLRSERRVHWRLRGFRGQPREGQSLGFYGE
jgi:hypothetical protein